MYRKWRKSQMSTRRKDSSIVYVLRSCVALETKLSVYDACRLASKWLRRLSNLGRLNRCHITIPDWTGQMPEFSTSRSAMINWDPEGDGGFRITLFVQMYIILYSKLPVQGRYSVNTNTPSFTSLLHDLLSIPKLFH